MPSANNDHLGNDAGRHSGSRKTPCPADVAPTVTQQRPDFPKVSSPIPNRIFVGGLPSNTSEQELKTFFASHGPVKDVKIIIDRSGQSKGYGFVTFESKETAEKLIQNEMENVFFKERRLNIGHAYRKGPIYGCPRDNSSVFFTSGSVPYTYQNGMAVFHVPHGTPGYPDLAYPAPTSFMSSPYAMAYLPSQSNSPWAASGTPRPLAAAAGPNWPLQPQPMSQSQTNTPSHTPTAESPYVATSQNMSYCAPELLGHIMPTSMTGLTHHDPNQSTTSDYSSDHSFAADQSCSSGYLDCENAYHSAHVVKANTPMYYPHYHYMPTPFSVPHYPSFRPMGPFINSVASPPPVARLQPASTPYGMDPSDDSFKFGSPHFGYHMQQTPSPMRGQYSEQRGPISKLFSASPKPEIEGAQTQSNSS